MRPRAYTKLREPNLVWKLPKLLPSFPTWPAVTKNLANGADLMIPGIVVDQERGIKAYQDGQLKKVRLTRPKSLPCVSMMNFSLF